MFILKKLITPFLLPPGIFAVSLLASTVWFLIKRDRKAGFTTLIIGCLVWLLSLPPVGFALLEGLESRHSLPTQPDGDVIILLGAGIHEKVPDFSGLGTPSEHALSRVVTVVRLYQTFRLPIIVSGGKIFEHRTAEALILKRFLVDLGVSSQDIITEENSHDTMENALYTRRICDRFGYKHPILVTSAYHMNRSVVSFKKAGLDVIPFPTDFKTWEHRTFRWTDYLPGSFKNSRLAIKEYIGIFFYNLAY
jgi:uncharacterized SAM-binding protein YcdF (DUF218 family)